MRQFIFFILVVVMTQPCFTFPFETLNSFETLKKSTLFKTLHPHKYQLLRVMNPSKLLAFAEEIRRLMRDQPEKGELEFTLTENAHMWRKIAMKAHDLALPQPLCESVIRLHNTITDDTKAFFDDRDIRHLWRIAQRNEELCEMLLTPF